MCSIEEHYGAEKASSSGHGRCRSAPSIVSGSGGGGACIMESSVSRRRLWRLRWRMRRSTASLSSAPATGCRYRQLVTGTAADDPPASTLPPPSPSPYPAGGGEVVLDTMDDDMAEIDAKPLPLTLIELSRDLGVSSELGS
nr:unnamed protein product [Digitaria exilis]